MQLVIANGVFERRIPPSTAPLMSHQVRLLLELAETNRSPCQSAPGVAVANVMGLFEVPTAVNEPVTVKLNGPLNSTLTPGRIVRLIAVKFVEITYGELDAVQTELILAAVTGVPGTDTLMSEMLSISTSKPPGGLSPENESVLRPDCNVTDKDCKVQLFDGEEPAAK